MGEGFPQPATDCSGCSGSGFDEFGWEAPGAAQHAVTGSAGAGSSAGSSQAIIGAPNSEGIVGGMAALGEKNHEFCVGGGSSGENSMLDYASISELNQLSLERIREVSKVRPGKGQVLSRDSHGDKVGARASAEPEHV